MNCAQRSYINLFHCAMEEYEQTSTPTLAWRRPERNEAPTKQKSVSAQAWNKPKVEETFSVHNMPGGIPLEFLKQLIPDAITIDVEDESLKFTQDGR